ncbi:hypothetical protein AB9E07_35095, partial [Rhizobium leguminosarum]
GACATRRGRGCRPDRNRICGGIMSFLSRIMVLKSQSHFSAGVYNRFGGPSPAGLAIEGSRKKKSGHAQAPSIPSAEASILHYRP